jgi:hypothetical protein
MQTPPITNTRESTVELFWELITAVFKATMARFTRRG